MIDPRTPILVGVGQAVDQRADGAVADAPSPVGMAVRAAMAALGDTGVSEMASAIDRVIVIRTMADSLSATRGPFGRCANPPGTVAARLGITEAAHIYSITGGDQPQALVAEAAALVHCGAARAVLIASGEATAAAKAAMRVGLALDWSGSADGDFEDRGTGPMLLTPYEIANGLGMPVTTYPVFEHALRARMGLDRTAWRKRMATVLAPMSDVAAGNPYSQFPMARSVDFLADESAENYAVADPYLKWHVAQDAVNQGAAVVVTTVGEATALGIDPGKFVYLHGHAELADAPVMQRPDLSRSRAFEGASALALSAAGRMAADIAHLDLYSCFPCAIELGAEALGIDPMARATTVTGGLPFFGGPGNSYSLHAIATMAERLRAEPDAYGLVLANGGFLSKAAVGVYSATSPMEWSPVSSAAAQRELHATDLPEPVSGDGEGVVESYTVTMTKGQASAAALVVRTSAGRMLARVKSEDFGTLQDREPVGAAVSVRSHEGRNTVETIGAAATARRG
jgi:acetyl-CoA C-acetyltransferase